MKKWFQFLRILRRGEPEPCNRLSVSVIESFRRHPAAAVDYNRRNLSWEGKAFERGDENDER